MNRVGSFVVRFSVMQLMANQTAIKRVNQRLSELFEFGNPERIPKSSGSGVRSEGLFSVGIRSEVVQFGRSENPEFPNPENIDLLS